MNKDEITFLLTNHQYRLWNAYRHKHPKWIPDLSGMDLSQIDFVRGANFSFNLTYANLDGAILPKERRAYRYESNQGRSFRKITNTAQLKNAKITNRTELPDFEIGFCGVIMISDESIPTTSINSVFISYAWAEEDVVLAIDQWLRNKQLITKIDKRDFFAGARIRDEITRVMKGCDAILIFYSRISKDKPWTEFERELATDLEMEAKKEGVRPPRIIYIVTDETPLPSVSEKNRIAIMAKGKRFTKVCEEIYHAILQLPKAGANVDLSEWDKYEF